jgi:hypothetical protein
MTRIGIRIRFIGFESSLVIPGGADALVQRVGT